MRNEIFLSLLLGFLLDCLVGDPHSIPHPVVLIGKLISALETVAELTRLSKLHPAEILTLTAAQAHKVGPYSMMQGQNPIYLFTFDGK